MTTGITYYEEDRGHGPFVLRQSGSNNFVTEINTSYYSRFGNPAESVVFGKGWDNPKNISFKTMKKALEAAEHVFRIEGIHISVEPKNP
jgi:hypothetical protein